MEHSLNLLRDALNVNKLLLKRAVSQNDIKRILELKFHRQLINETMVEIYSEGKLYGKPTR